MTGTAYPKDGKIIWFNLRQECSILVNGEPFCGRPANKIGEYAELGAVTAAMLEKDEPEFAKVCENRAKHAGNKLKTIDVNKKGSLNMKGPITEICVAHSTRIVRFSCF